MLVRKTLATLARGNFQGSLFVVVPSAEIAVYHSALVGSPVHTILMHTEKGLVKQRRFFRGQMLPGTEIVWIDDDLEAIKILNPGGLHHCTRLNDLANFVFESMACRDPSGGCLLAGVYPIANRVWMKPKVTESNSYVVGAMYFSINDERLKEPEADELEDYYRCLSEQAAGRPVLRLNWVGIQTQYWKNEGGMQQERTEAKRHAAVHKMVAEFPELVKAKTRRDGKLDLKFLQQAVYWTAAPLPS